MDPGRCGACAIVGPVRRRRRVRRRSGKGDELKWSEKCNEKTKSSKKRTNKDKVFGHMMNNMFGHMMNNKTSGGIREHVRGGSNLPAHQEWTSFPSRMDISCYL